MTEIWLHANRRATALAMLPAVAGGGSGLWLALSGAAGWWGRAVGGALMAMAAVWILGMIRRWRRPRLALRNGNLSIYLRGGSPIQLPVDVVECFLLGQGPTFLHPALGGRGETKTIVMRLAESAHQWQHVDVDPKLGSWCDGYVTLRGTWCEPLSVEVVNRLNRQLAGVHQAVQEAASR